MQAHSYSFLREKTEAQGLKARARALTNLAARLLAIEFDESAESLSEEMTAWLDGVSQNLLDYVSEQAQQLPQ